MARMKFTDLFHEALEQARASLPETNEPDQIVALEHIAQAGPKIKHGGSDILETMASFTHSPDHQWYILGNYTVSLAEDTLQRLFDLTDSIAEETQYWENIPRSNLSLALFAVQSTPGHLYDAAASAYRSTDVTAKNWTLGTLGATVYGRVSAAFLQFRSTAVSKRWARPYQHTVKDKLHMLREIKNDQALFVGQIAAAVLFNQAASLQDNIVNLVQTLCTVTKDVPPGDDEQNAVETLNRNDPANLLQNLILGLSPPPAYLSAALEARLESCRKPSRIVRYWPAVCFGYLGGSTILRALVNRQADIKVWLSDLASTTQSFWQNWIIEPARDIIATIRHDKGSEVALISSRSLAADMDSLVRMVADFAVDNPRFAKSTDLSTLRSAAREGDLTPVLLAYEEYLKTPLRSAVTGSLVRSLLVQVQKTKVDVEVAISGIDKLLKSQELVFGFVGISPAIGILWFLKRSLSNSRIRSQNIDSRKSQMERFKMLYRLSCALSDCTGRISEADFGTVLCEVQLLRRSASNVDHAIREIFLDDLSMLEIGCDRKASSMNAVLERLYRVSSLQ